MTKSALSALVDNLGLVPSTHGVVNNHVQLLFQEIWCLLLASMSTTYMRSTYLQTCKYLQTKILIHRIKKRREEKRAQKGAMHCLVLLVIFF